MDCLCFLPPLSGCQTDQHSARLDLYIAHQHEPVLRLTQHDLFIQLLQEFLKLFWSFGRLHLLAQPLQLRGHVFAAPFKAKVLAMRLHSCQRRGNGREQQRNETAPGAVHDAPGAPSAQPGPKAPTAAEDGAGLPLPP